jgi:hypothetical protein
MSPTYDIQFCYVYEHTCANLPRTINNAEGYPSIRPMGESTGFRQKTLTLDSPKKQL